MATKDEIYEDLLEQRWEHLHTFVRELKGEEEEKAYPNREDVIAGVLRYMGRLEGQR